MSTEQLDEMVSPKGKALRTMAMKLEQQIAKTSDPMKKRDLRVRWHNTISTAAQHDIKAIRKSASALPTEMRKKHNDMINKLEMHTMAHNDEAMKLMRMKGPIKPMTEELNEAGPQMGRVKRNLMDVERHKQAADNEADPQKKNAHLARMHLSHTSALSAERMSLDSYMRKHPDQAEKYAARRKAVDAEQEHHDRRYLHHAMLAGGHDSI